MIAPRKSKSDAANLGSVLVVFAVAFLYPYRGYIHYEDIFDPIKYYICIYSVSASTEE